MAKKPLSDAVCQRRLTKYIEGKYTEHEQEIIEYYNDIIGEKHYAFKYKFGMWNYLLVIDRMTEKIYYVEKESEVR